MKETNFMVLTHCNMYVDANLLMKGIYTTNTPTLYSNTETIESLVTRALMMKDLTGESFISDEYITNLKQCKLTEVVLSIK